VNRKIAFLAGALLLVTIPGAATAQEAVVSARNAVYLELGGNGIAYSVNYDRRFGNVWTGRAGFMIFEASGIDESTGNEVDVSIAIIPVMANALVGKGTHRLELGIGPLFAMAGGDIEDANVGEVDEFSSAGLAGVTGTFGYRRQPADGGFVFRASLVPFYSGRPQLWAGLSFGWAF
jgi:hypothetical protein